ncbi:RNA polymerase sigma factor SigJ [Catelliglobosispora koreensis]|uniref:RNA polymerase sigma factor SigJ n=1 Tax=Catelliglobosispora koreensis TaxID=129052 RepID=UPI000365A538|nr:RNA polymerase sigma factor SigJ [Catelliglobosispora koreensis]
MSSQDEAAEEFQRHRPRLLGVAYRLLGSAWDAEDVVEEAAIRWLQTDRTGIAEPAAFLTTVVTRLALDHLKSARVRRESYYGPWLPEPVPAGRGQLGPLETAEQRESLSLATMRLMERLTPPERGVYVLRTAFDMPYAEIAEILSVSVDSARQLFHRAQNRISGVDRFESSPAEHTRLLESFLAAAAKGDFAGLTSMLAQDVVVYADGGGKLSAALKPVTGIDHVSRYLTGLLNQFPVEGLEFIEANGNPAVLVTMNGQPHLVAIAIRDGKLAELYVVRNPDKLHKVA